MISKEKAKQLLLEQINAAQSLSKSNRQNPEFAKWHRDTKIVIEKSFPKDGSHLKDFHGISYHLAAFGSNTPEYEFQQAYQRGLTRACSILQSMIEEIDKFGIEDSEASPKVDVFDTICFCVNDFILQLGRCEIGTAGEPRLK